MGRTVNIALAPLRGLLWDEIEAWLAATIERKLEERGVPNVQFFFNETKSKDEVSRFWLWDSHRENPVGDVEKRLPYLPQDRRSRSDPYLGIPPR